MTDHLPECPKFISEFHEYCECTILRACEQRVRDEEDRMVPIIRRNEYERGLDAARDAVPHDEACFSNDADADERDCNCWRPIALAAIDALRGES